MTNQDFTRNDTRSGVLLVFVTLLALLVDNSPFAWLYDSLLSVPLSVSIGEFEIFKPLLLWINDGLMAIFFFLIGLEIKREILQGELSSFQQAGLPVIAALGGLIVPAIIYLLFNFDDPIGRNGWGIPVATDIAFALAVLSLLGPRVPATLKVLLLSLAIIDDIGAILIIAVFYTENLSIFALVLSSIGILGAIALNRFGIKRTAPYVLVGIFIWACVLKSGVHATLAGVVLAFTIPLKDKDSSFSPLKHLEHALHPWVVYLIMPAFAFANAGVSFANFSPGLLYDAIPLGIIAGLVLGKQIGVFGFAALSVLLGICKLPKGVNWYQFYGMSALCGIGFTMSLFIGTLSFDDPVLVSQIRLAILAASLISAVWGYAVLSTIGRKKLVAAKETMG